MSLVSLAFYFVFGGNVLLQWGVIPAGRDGAVGNGWLIPLGIGAGAAAAVVDGMVSRYLLMP